MKRNLIVASAIHFTDSDKYAYIGDLAVHDKGVMNLAIYRSGNLMFSTPCDLHRLESLIAVEWLKPHVEGAELPVAPKVEKVEPKMPRVEDDEVEFHAPKTTEKMVEEDEEEDIDLPGEDEEAEAPKAAPVVIKEDDKEAPADAPARKLKAKPGPKPKK